MSKPLQGKVAMITGAARDTGAAIVRKLAAQGASVAVQCHRHAEEGEALVSELAAAGGQACLYRCDFADLSAIRNFVGQVQSDFGRIDIAVSNVSAPCFKPMAMVSDEDIVQLTNVNVIGAFVFLQEIAQYIADDGRVIHISTAGTKKPMAGGGGVFAGTKAAADQFVLAMAPDLGPRGVTTNIVSISGIKSQAFYEQAAQAADLFAKLTGGETPPIGPDMPDPRAALSPLGYVPETWEIADLVAFLAGPGGRLLTGQNIFATAGTLLNL